MKSFIEFMESNKNLKDDEIREIAKKNKVDFKQLKAGIEVEKEHKDVFSKESDFAKIALAHLKEIPDYYTRLDKMEKQAKK